MAKKWISLLLVFVMVLSLFPMTVFAADNVSSVNPETGREQDPKGSEDVAVMVYGKTIADAVMKSGYDFEDFVAALKSEMQGVLANEKLPEVEMYLVNDQNQEYKLTKNAVNQFTTKAKEFLDKIIGSIDTTNHIEDQMDDIQDQFRDMMRDSISSIMKNVIQSVFQTIKEILSWKN